MVRKLLKITLIILIAGCIFDPADLLLGMKMPLFLLAWLLFLSDSIINKKVLRIPMTMVVYLGLFILIPLISIVYYYFNDNKYVNFDGFQYLKAYLFLTIVIVLYVARIDLIKPALIILSLLSVVTILILILYYVNNSLAQRLYENIGLKYTIWAMGSKDYGKFILPSAPQVFFHTSPLIVFPITYFTKKAFYAQGINKATYVLLAAINIVAMFCGATRSNIVISIITPVFTAYWYSRRKVFIFIGVAILISILYVNYWEAIRISMFRPEQTSNRYKLSFVKDYYKLFSDNMVLLFGQGLGSYFRSSIRGYVSVTELTYLEFLRRFGVVLSLPSLVLILYPLSKLKQKKYHQLHYIFIAYFFYLIMCFSNPLLMSSTGMLLLSLVLYKTFVPLASTTHQQQPYMTG
ncbi:MAG: hypothetical protein PHH44_02335 [bacterium]|nr:hypothetical protein [bacterium]